MPRKPKAPAAPPEPAASPAPAPDAAPPPDAVANAAPVAPSEAVPEPAPAAAKKPAKEKAPKAPKASSKKKGEPTIADVIEQVMSDTRVVYFPVKHFSPACALHVDRLIRELKPVGVLVEGPEDATELIPYIVHEDTRPPLTIFSSYVDKDNRYGLNGVLSPSPEVPARYRGWWPLTDYAPEYAALRAGHAVGARLVFCDVPLTATIPHHHVPRREGTQRVEDRHLATNAYFDALCRRQRRRSFDEFWNANFEVCGHAMDPWAFMRRVLTFAHCARLACGDEGAAQPALEADGTLLREAHMRFVLDTFLKEHPEGKVVVVTGAFHSVALPFTKKKKAPVKSDKNLETLLTAHSFQALANLYELNRLPAWSQAAWEQLVAGAEQPFNAASLKLLIEIMRRARALGEGVSTADAVGAYTVARNLATLRENSEVTLEDLTDAVRMGYVKGDFRLRGATVEKASRDTLVGVTLGRVTSEAGQAPLIRDYYAQSKAHKLDVTGVFKEVRCDLHKQEGHRHKSAFLHQCDFLTVPMFTTVNQPSNYYAYQYSAMPIPKPSHFKGPDLVTGENMHLITETWGVQWRVTVDDRLLEVADRGASIAQAAASLLREQLTVAAGNARDTTRLLLRSAQMGLTDMFAEVLTAVEDAIVVDSSFDNLATALQDFVVLHSYRDAVATQGHARLLGTITTLFNKATLVMPSIANASGDAVPTMLDRLQSLVRITLTFEAVELDRQLLVEKLFEMVARPDGTPVVRGAGFGILFSFGATREKVVARELDGYLLGSPDRVLQAGAFLDGLFLSSKNIFMGSPRLLRAINGVLKELDWATFKILLPDLRRAFTQFIPTEIDSISVKVSEELGLDEAPAVDVPVPDALARVAGGADERVRRVLAEWC